MTTEECKPGVRVYYYPYMGGKKKYLGMIASTPWQLGETWVCRLVDMEEAYGRECYININRTYVAAAAITNMELAG